MSENKTMISTGGFKVIRDPSEKLVGEVIPSKMTAADIAKYGPPNTDIKPQVKPYFNSLEVKKIREGEKNEMFEQKISKEQLIEELKDKQFTMDRYREIAAKYNMSENSIGSLVSHYKIKEHLGVKVIQGKPVTFNFNKDVILDICRKHGTGKEAYEMIVVRYGCAFKTAQNIIGKFKIVQMLQEERNKAAEESKPVEEAIETKSEKPETKELLPDKPEPAKRKYYISTSWLNKEKAAELSEIVERLGHEITYKWWLDTETEDIDTLYKCGLNDLAGVEQADTLLMLLPGREGTHTEYGAALALKKKIVLYNPESVFNLFYLQSKQVRSEMELIKEII